METAMGEKVLWGKGGREKRQGTQEKQQQETGLVVKLSASPTEEQKGISLHLAVVWCEQNTGGKKKNGTGYRKMLTNYKAIEKYLIML